MNIINIAHDFSDLPGPRYRRQGPGSGEEFLKEHLRPAFVRASRAGTQVTVQLDGVRYGYPTSFLEEAFGGLAREFGQDRVLETLRFVSATEPLLIHEIQHYIERAAVQQLRAGKPKATA